MPALKGRDISAFQALPSVFIVNQGRRASRLPLAFIFRAFGAGPDSIFCTFGAVSSFEREELAAVVDGHNEVFEERVADIQAPARLVAAGAFREKRN